MIKASKETMDLNDLPKKTVDAKSKLKQNALNKPAHRKAPSVTKKPLNETKKPQEKKFAKATDSKGRGSARFA